MAIYVRFQTPKEVQDLAYDLVEKARDSGKIGKGQTRQQNRVSGGEKYSLCVCSK